jgi:hypothetical protein
MANVTIPQLPVATTSAGADLLPVEQSGVTKQMTRTVLLTNATLTTPVLGTPQSGTLTNCTGLPIIAGTTGTLSVARGGTGITAFGTGVATALGQNVTGSGGIALATSPTFVTPTLGVATATTITTNELRGTVQSLSGAGAVNITDFSTAFTSTATGNALTLANGNVGEFKTVVYVAEAAGGDTGVLTPTTRVGYSTITFTNVGDSVTLQYFTQGWAVIGVRGATVA